MAAQREIFPSQAYIPTTPQDQTEMFRTIGINSIDELFEDIPPQIRDPHIDLPLPLTEMELMAEMKIFAASNRSLPSFLGAGVYKRFQPAIVRAITGRDEFLTSYTPYQAEISQGTLQTSFENETMMVRLFDMEVANTGMYDGATAMAEAALMAVRVQREIRKTEKKKIVALDTVHPNWLDVTRTYLWGRDLELSVVSEDSLNFDETVNVAAVIVQSPNYLGNIEDLKALGEFAHKRGALFIAAQDPISVGMLKPAGEFGADIVVAEGQSLGHLPNFGGVNLGIFTSRQEYLRKMPGRIVGQAKDEDGRVGYVLTIQPREQHIARERATSNICTAEQLIATAATIYLAALGDDGLKSVAALNYHNAHYLARKIAEIPGYKLPFEDKHFFNEFTVECPVPPVEINAYLLRNGVIGGRDVSDKVDNGMLLCATEMTTREQMDNLVDLLKAA